jgi:hypothetical protein
VSVSKLPNAKRAILRRRLPLRLCQLARNATEVSLIHNRLYVLVRNITHSPASLPQDHSHFECSKCSSTKQLGEAVDPGDPTFMATGIVAAPPGPVIVNDLGPIEPRTEEGTEGTDGTQGGENVFIDNIDPAFIASSIVAAPPGPVIVADLGPIRPRSEPGHSKVLTPFDSPPSSIVDIQIDSEFLEASNPVSDSDSSLLVPNLCLEEKTTPQILNSQFSSTSKEVPEIISQCPDPEEEAPPIPSPFAAPLPEEVLDAADEIPVVIHEDVEELAQQIDSVSGDVLPKLEGGDDADDAVETGEVGEAEEEEGGVEKPQEGEDDDEEEEEEEEKPEEDSDSSESDSDSSDTSDSGSDSDSSDSDGEEEDGDAKDEKKGDSKVEVDEAGSETGSSETDSVVHSAPSKVTEAEKEEKEKKEKEEDIVPEPTKTADTEMTDTSETETQPQQSLVVECITARDIRPEDHRHSDPEPNGDEAVARIETAELHRQQAEIIAERQKEKEQEQKSGASSRKLGVRWAMFLRI